MQTLQAGTPHVLRTLKHNYGYAALASEEEICRPAAAGTACVQGFSTRPTDPPLTTGPRASL